MLSQLYIQNFAVIKELTVNLKDGFNVFTGETGAGKSMLIYAINGVLGGRISKDFVRTGENKAIITAYFDYLPQNIIKICSDLGFDCEDELLISREITSEGKSQCKVNGKPATLNILRDITNNLITIHGQQENNIFSVHNSEVAFLDNYGDYKQNLDEYKKLYTKYTDIKNQIKSMCIDEAQKAQQIDILTYQINEIEEAEVSIGEEEKLLDARKKIRNSEKIKGNLNVATMLLYDNDNSIIDQMETVTSCLNEISSYFKQYESTRLKCQDMVYELQEVSNSMHHDLEEFDNDIDDIDFIENRLELLHKLKRKYGNSEEEILKFLKDVEDKLDKIKFSEENINKLNIQLEKINKELSQQADEITHYRKDCSADFIEKIKKELIFLDMSQVNILIEIAKKEYCEIGQDDVQFLISTNPGEPPKPISKIASGGETARIMLAIKNVLADKDKIPTLIFDEIDTGVSGIAAQKIGAKLKEVSQNHQIICITHLAQVASFGDTHYKIHKDFIGEHTFTIINEIVGKDREIELARIVVGDNITKASIQNAKEMLNMNSKRT